MDKRNRKKKTVDDTVCEIHKFSGYAVLRSEQLLRAVYQTRLSCYRSARQSYGLASDMELF